MAIDHPLLRDLIELADDVDLAILSAERGDDLALEARLEGIRDDANKLVAKIAKANASSRTEDWKGKP